MCATATRKIEPEVLEIYYALEDSERELQCRIFSALLPLSRAEKLAYLQMISAHAARQAAAQRPKLKVV